MSSVAPTYNGRASRATLNPLTTLLNLRARGADDSHLFELFAALAQEAGRDDLHEEFLNRALSTNISGRTEQATQSPSAERMGRRP
jgi:hypothetical protein